MKNDKNFKNYPKKLKQPKTAKHKINLFGQHAVRTAYLNPKRTFKKFYITEKALEGFHDVMKEAYEAGLERPNPEMVTRPDLDRSLGADTVHQGIAALTNDLPEISAMDLIIRERKNDKSVFVMLDHVTDPHNVGAIMRSGAAFGLAGLIMQTRFAPDIDGALAKVACGAVEYLPVATEINLSRAIETFREHGYTCIALDERGEETIGEAAKGLKKCLLVMGAEGPGLRPSVKESCNKVARLEMLGELPSINVSNAAAVSFYAVTSS